MPDEAHRTTVRAIMRGASPAHALMQARVSLESAWAETDDAARQLQRIHETAIGKAIGPAYDPHGSIDMRCDGCGAEVTLLRNQGGHRVFRLDPDAEPGVNHYGPAEVPCC